MTAAILDARASLLARRLHALGLQPGESARVAASIALCSLNAARFAVAREALRPLRVGASETRALLKASGMWAEELCANPACTREVHARMALTIVKGAAYCSPCCAIDALGVPA